jgi:hypothetical protein
MNGEMNETELNNDSEQNDKAQKQSKTRGGCRQNQLQMSSSENEREEVIRVSFFIVAVYEKGKRVLNVLKRNRV